MNRRLRCRLVAGVALGALGIGALGGLWHWLHRPTQARIERALREWAAARVLAESDTVYNLSLGRLRFDSTGTAITLDSLALGTDARRNARRPSPLPSLSIVVRGLHVMGLDLAAALAHRHRPISIDGIRFDSIEADVRLPPPTEVSGPKIRQASDRGAGSSRAPGAPANPPPPHAATLPAGRAHGVRLATLGRNALPGGLPDIRVTRIDLPSVELTVRPAEDPEGQIQSVRHLSIQLDGVLLESGDSTRTPIFAQDIRLRAEHYRGVWSRLASVTVERIEAGVRDSLLRLGDVDVRPTMSDAALRRLLRWRTNRLAAHAAGMEARGVNYGAMLAGSGLMIRSVRIAQPVFDLLLDRHLPPDPHPDPVRMPQQFLRSLGSRLVIDSVSVGDGRVSYGELEPGKPRPGVVTFEHLSATLRNVTNDPARSEEPMVLTARTDVMGSGWLRTTLEFPLGVSRFALHYSGRVAPMPMTAVNRFTAVNTRAKVRSGETQGLTFEGRVVNDSASGRVVLRYRDLKLGLTHHGGGLGGAIARRLGSFFINHFKLRRDNPGDDGRLMVGRIARRRRPSEGLFPFLWYTLRDAFRETMVR